MQTNTVLVALSLIGLGVLLELLIYISKFGWSNKKILASIAMLSSAFGTGALFVAVPSAASALLALLMIYRIVNLLRLVQARMHEQYLKRVTKRSFYWLILSQCVAIILWFVFTLLPSSVTGQTTLLFVSLSFLVGAVFILIYTILKLRSTRPTTAKPLSDKELPTVTVAVAARNETESLRQCLEAILANDYPKLEVIVLDDCSQDHTADIIKSFAHDGVRFVQGTEPSDTWLAKNAAYQKLLEESSGELIAFIGVDVRLHPKTLRHLVEVFTARNVSMMSILPKRTQSGLVAAFIQPMRYWWELALPKWIIKHEPVLSTSWIANRSALLAEGGFKSATRAITPEEHLATALAARGGYAFVRTDEQINITTHKDFKSQWSTAVRTRYPQMHRRPELTALRVVIMLYFLIAPFVVLPLLAFMQSVSSLVIVATASAVICLIVSNLLITLVTNPVAAWLAPINFPIVVLIDFVALHISMYRYEFGEVIWKGRDVTTPAMHVIPHLPALE
jgi:hypothetical protein